MISMFSYSSVISLSQWFFYCKGRIFSSESMLKSGMMRFFLFERLENYASLVSTVRKSNLPDDYLRHHFIFHILRHLWDVVYAGSKR